MNIHRINPTAAKLTTIHGRLQNELLEHVLGTEQLFSEANSSGTAGNSRTSQCLLVVLLYTSLFPDFDGPVSAA